MLCVDKCSRNLSMDTYKRTDTYGKHTATKEEKTSTVHTIIIIIKGNQHIQGMPYVGICGSSHKARIHGVCQLDVGTHTNYYNTRLSENRHHPT